MRKCLWLIALLLGTSTLSFAQNENKFSAGTRFIISERDGKLSLGDGAGKKGKSFSWQNIASISGKPINAVGKIDTQEAADGNGLPIAEPFYVNGVKTIQAWIKLDGKDYSQLENLGVEILNEFDGMVTANIPVNALEDLADLVSVKKISVAKKLQAKTYYGRQKTNADDVIYYSNDAQIAGLLKAYDGKDVVIGIIDTGIQFDHVMFKDENGKTRIKKAYVYSNNRLNEYTGDAVSSLTYDISSEDHGTHTSSIAGGSDYVFNGYYYDNDLGTYTTGTRTYGGMAPKADLVLCGLAGQLTDANIAACIKGISDYADEVGKPCVISISLGSHYGPHDGTGEMAEVARQYTGPGKVIVYAAGNEGDEKIYFGGEASRENPLSTLFDYTYSTNYLYGGSVTYAREANVPLAARFYVVDTSTNEVVWYSSEMTEDTEYSVNDQGEYGGALSQYFTAYRNQSNNYGFLVAYFDNDPNNGKNIVETVGYYLVATNSKYSIGFSVYPSTAGVTANIDSWGLQYAYFNGLEAPATLPNGSTISFVDGNGEVSASDESTYPDVIPIGAYTSGKGYVSSGGYVYTVYDDVDDVVSFSSYQEEGKGPLGIKLPWITAPGNIITAGFNRGNTSTSGSNGYDELIYGFDSSNPIGTMSGTSMAAPAAAGIVALWLQANPNLTPEEVKNVMKETAIQDSYVSGNNSVQFGNGKIDALAGIKYILGDDAVIIAEPTALSFNTKPETEASQTISVKAKGLTTDIAVTLEDANGVFSVDKESLSVAEATDGVEITVTFSPAVEGKYVGTITLSSEGVDDVVISLNAQATEGGTASDVYLDIAKYATIDDAGWDNTYVRDLYSYTEYPSDGAAWLTLSTYGAWSSVYYNSHPQKWIESSLGTSNTYAGTTWNATDVFLGATNYFTTTSGNANGRSRAIGYNSRNNTAERSVTFYVTNTTAVKLLGVGANGASNTYPASLRVYEATVNGDGSISAAANPTQSATNSSTSTNTPYTLSISNLDAEKIYKVVANTFRGYIYEVAFQTPLNNPRIIADPVEVAFNSSINTVNTEIVNVSGFNLEGDITATLSDDNGVFSIDTESISIDEAAEGKDITVTFSTAVGGNFTGTITLSSENAEDVVVNLSAHADNAYNLNVTSLGLSTLYLDFPVEIPYDTYDPDLLGVYYVYDIAADGELKLARLHEKIPANTAVIVQANSGDYLFVETDNADELPRTNLLKGSLVDIAVADALAAEQSNGTVYTLGMGKERYVGFYKYSGTTLKANKAFLIIEGEGNAKGFYIGFDDVANAIKKVDATAETGEWYTIQGIRLNGKPTEKGIYINNGKAIIIK